MSVGIDKCGILSISPREDLLNLWEPMTADHPDYHLCTLLSDRIPIVDSYDYLGMRLSPDFTTASILKPCFDKARKLSRALAPFLVSQQVSLASRLTLLRSVMLPQMLYGAELYGMKRMLTDRMQQHVNFCLCCLLGLRSSKAAAGLWAEFQIPPICASAAACRIRAYQKAATLCTEVQRFVQHPLQIRKWTWVTGMTRWMNRYRSALIYNDRDLQDWPTWIPSLAKCATQTAVWQRETFNKSIHGATGWQTCNYLLGRYHRNNLSRICCGFCPELNPGFALII